jgi:hypothetical protein
LGLAERAEWLIFFQDILLPDLMPQRTINFATKVIYFVARL